jgi:copper transport protein
MGHAAAQDGLAVGVVWLHLLAASVWVGGLAALVVGVLYGRMPRKLARAVWLSFGRVAAVSVGLLVASGIYAAGRQVASVDAALTSTYGHVLLAKLGLVALLGGLAVASTIVLRPSVDAPLLAGRLLPPLQRAPHPARRISRHFPRWTASRCRWLGRLVWGEAAVGGLVVLAASLLAANPPARGPEYERPAAPAPPAVFTQSAADLLVTLEVKPNRPGPNVITVRAVSTRRPTPGPVEQVVVRLTPPGAQLASPDIEAGPAEASIFRLSGARLDQSGAWQADVLARRSGHPDVVTHFDWSLPPVLVERTPLLSDRPLEPLLSPLAAAIFALVALTTLGAALRARRGTWLQPLGPTSRTSFRDPSEGVVQ